MSFQVWKKRTLMLALILWLHTLQLSNLPLNPDHNLPTHHLAHVCNLVIKGVALPAPRDEISEVTMSSIGIFSFDVPELFNFFFSESFYRKIIYFDNLLLSFVILWA